MNKKYHIVNSLILVLISVIISVIVISLLPDFMFDDYYIFAKIHNSPTNPFSLNPDIDFLLFFRPISYFSFWLDYHLFYNNAVLMKIHSVVYFILSASLIYLFFLYLLKLLKRDVNSVVLLLLSVIFIFHPDNLINIYWISNRTEILSFVFYLMAILFFFKWVINPKFIYRALITVFFVLAILTKQSTLNLPFILVIFYQIIKKEKIVSVLKKFKAEFFIVLIFIIVNFFASSYESSVFLSNLWKKIFSVLGVLLCSFNVFIGEKVYTFFLFHKLLAITLLILSFVIFFVGLIIKRSRILLFLKRYFPYLLLILFSFFPRIFAAGGRRLNTLQIFFLLVVFFFIFIENYQSKIKKYLLGFLYFWLILTILNGAYELKRTVQIQKNSELKVSGLFKYSPTDDYLILIDKDIKLLPYKTYYFKYHNWGKTNFEIRSFHFVMLNSIEDEKLFRKIDVKQKENEIIITASKFAILLYDPKIDGDVIISETPVNTGRFGYQELVIDKRKVNARGKKTIYFDGEKWNEL